jgi:acetamidase/formamidase
LSTGAKPGDALKVTLEGFQPKVFDGKGFGWTANIPGFGLLADQFTDPALCLWSYDPASMAPAMWGKIGAGAVEALRRHHRQCAPAEAGLHSVVPPRRVGGNLDIRDLTGGHRRCTCRSRWRGRLFSVGDTHAAQGDGEVCGTAIESPMNVVLTLDLVKDQPLKTPRFTTPGPVTRHLDAKGYEVTTGIGPDLMTTAPRCGVGDGRSSDRAAGHLGGRRLYAVFGLRRPADFRDRRHAELGGQLLLPAGRLRMTLAEAMPNPGP